MTHILVDSGMSGYPDDHLVLFLLLNIDVTKMSSETIWMKRCDASKLSHAHLRTSRRAVSDLWEDDFEQRVLFRVSLAVPRYDGDIEGRLCVFGVRLA